MDFFWAGDEDEDPAGIWKGAGKESKTSFQDYYNESVAVYESEGKNRTLSIVYLRYFEEHMDEFTPFLKNPIFSRGEEIMI